MWFDYIYDFIITQEFPYSIRGYYYELILFSQIKFQNFWISNATHLCSTMITERSSHCKSWNILVLMPNTWWPHGPALWIFKCLYPASMLQNSAFLIRLSTLMIPVQGIPLQLHPIICISSSQHSSRIPHIRTKDLIPYDQDGHTSWTTEVNIYSWGVVELMSHVGETCCESIFYFVTVDDSLGLLGHVENLLDLNFNLLCQTILNKLTNLFPIHPMPITHSKKVCPPILPQMWQR